MPGSRRGPAGLPAVRHGQLAAARGSAPASGEILLGFAVRQAGRTSGRLQDNEIDAGRWLVASLVLDSGVWLPGRRRVIAPREVRAIDWIARTIALG